VNIIGTKIMGKRVKLHVLRLLNLVRFSVGVVPREISKSVKENSKPVQFVILIQRLAAELKPPGDSALPNRELLERVRVAMRVFPPGGICSVDRSEALRTWRYVTLARRYESGSA